MHANDVEMLAMTMLKWGYSPLCISYHTQPQKQISPKCILAQIPLKYFKCSKNFLLSLEEASTTGCNFGE